MDTFGDSLIFVNQLYNRELLNPDDSTQPSITEQKKVPAHMPHFIQRDIMEELQARFPEQWAATSSHRFRHGQDMQFGFAYFYYLQHRAVTADLDWDALWRDEVDVDHSGYLDENELLTLAAMANGKEPSDDFVFELRQCLAQAADRVRELERTHGRASAFSRAASEASSSSSSPAVSRALDAAAAAAEAAEGAAVAARDWLEDATEAVAIMVLSPLRQKFGMKAKEGESGLSAGERYAALLRKQVDRQAKRERGEHREEEEPLLFTGKAMVECDVAVEGLRRHARRPDGLRFEKITQLDEVAFEMIGDDFNKTVSRSVGQSAGRAIRQLGTGC